MRRFAVIGSPIAHSLSPEVYGGIFSERGIDAEFDRIEVLPCELPRVRGLLCGYDGFAVTMPHKRTIIEYIDEIDISAAACGAVNIVSVTQNVLRGYNTDGTGLADALAAAGIEMNTTIAILGRGGAAQAALYALKQAGAKVMQYVRSISAHAGDAEQRLFIDSELTPCGIFINATPLGMAEGEQFQDFHFLDKMQPRFVFDMVYRRNGETPLIDEAQRRGIPCSSGYPMLYHQALRAVDIWFRK